MDTFRDLQASVCQKSIQASRDGNRHWCHRDRGNAWQKYYRRHTGYIGGLKETKYKTLMATKPEFAMELAVKGMLPKNTIGRAALTRLKVFKGTEHPHAAQKPIAWQE